MSQQNLIACRLCRSAGEKLFLKGIRCNSPKCTLTRRAYAPGQHGEKRRGKISEYGKQLSEKQKVRRIYNVGERQMRKMFELAAKSKANTGERLLQLMEMRLDNILYRAGLAPSRKAASQIVSHGNVTVDNKKVSVRSYIVKPGETIKVVNFDKLKEHFGAIKMDVPSWLSVDEKTNILKVTAIPSRDQMSSDIEDQLIIEFYSRLT
jgi:small subunit ribosomal protein S4